MHILMYDLLASVHMYVLMFSLLNDYRSVGLSGQCNFLTELLSCFFFRGISRRRMERSDDDLVEGEQWRVSESSWHTAKTFTLMRLINGSEWSS